MTLRKGVDHWGRVVAARRARVESAWFQRLKLKYNKLLSGCAINFNLRPYSGADYGAVKNAVKNKYLQNLMG